ncbi:MAG: hypothetical protein ABR549_02475 [Mycobacteriales bacterium]
MRRTVLVAVAATSLLGLPAISSTASADGETGEKQVCAQAPAGAAACHAKVRTKGAKPAATVTRSSGYVSADLRAAYNLTGDSAATVAIVDAYAHPNAAADLAAYRADTGLPALTAGQFTQYNQNGGSTLPSADVGWGQEEMLDLEMVSAICPSCQIVYVGANSASFNDLATAVNTAATKATVISNSYGGREFSSETTLQSAYNHPGIAITVSSGDSGYGVQAPAAFNTVTAVGGTSLRRSSTARGWTETAWSGAGSGCSAYISKPTWQVDTSCSRRSVADVSAVADPSPGVAVYDSYGSSGGADWYVFGGTLVAAPIIGAVYALSGNTSGTPASIAYANPSALFDVTSGSNGRCVHGKQTAGAYLCTALTGYDGPTGLGTPNGTAAF